LADLDDIFAGLGANLAALKQAEIAPRQPLIQQVSAYLLDNPSPPSVMVAGVDVDGVDFQTFGREDVAWTILIEVCLGRVSDIGAQKLLRKLLAGTGETSLVQAVEANQTLTSRLLDDGTVQTDQDAAAEKVTFAGYRGQTQFRFPGQEAPVLLATWAFGVYGL
jgi:hypothetical protein